MFKRVVVVNKWTYLLLLIPLISIINIIYDAFVLLPDNMIEFISNAFMEAIIGAIGFYFFIRLNTHSAFHNPDHPLAKDNNK